MLAEEDIEQPESHPKDYGKGFRGLESNATKKSEGVDSVKEAVTSTNVRKSRWDGKPTMPVAADAEESPSVFRQWLI